MERRDKTWQDIRMESLIIRWKLMDWKPEDHALRYCGKPGGILADHQRMAGKIYSTRF